MAVRHLKRAVGVFPDLENARGALEELKDNHFPMERVSVIAKDTETPLGADIETERKGNKADEGAAVGAATGGALGTLGGLLVGLGALAIPGIGPVMLAGATATALATTISGGAIGAAAGGLVGALVGLGIPEKQAKIYNDRVAQGDYLIIIEGTDDEIHRAEEIVQRRGIEEWGIYEAPEATGTTATQVHPQNEVVRRETRVVDEEPVIDREKEVVREEKEVVREEKEDVVYSDDVMTVVDRSEHHHKKTR
ncbi:DUF1269 domain-containing protein [Phormidium sp. CCY1219]|uniref:DUF1269 domain-containing protein n=1 Tax=Phormidium sp. CCY1219 TaxID=2886104 RepID=UPI002D1EC978|nr:DUF1269 domain-containing protein [Phormidium sp. CCY1219]MEB3828962.1 DUF1269 domain-containing protein [Phormidium sp. CCY1219]